MGNKIYAENIRYMKVKRILRPFNTKKEEGRNEIIAVCVCILVKAQRYPQ